jgi:hypothetical protein
MAIYLNDHLAGSTTLIARLWHAVKQHESTELRLSGRADP